MRVRVAAAYGMFCEDPMEWLGDAGAKLPRRRARRSLRDPASLASLRLQVLFAGSSKRRAVRILISEKYRWRLFLGQLAQIYPVGQRSERGPRAY
jgi:hypothetical protein